MSCLSKLCSSKPHPQDSELVRTTPITPELREKMKKQRESDKKIEQVVNGLRDGQVFPKKEIT
jgi:hypothetical protein